MLSHSAFRYLSVGLVNTGVGLGTIYACLYFLKWSDVSANIAGYSLGITIGYVLNRNWTFSDRRSPKQTFLRYILVILVAYIANLTTVLLLREYFELNAYLAHVLGILPYTMIGYLGSRYFAFAVVDDRKIATSGKT